MKKLLPLRAGRALTAPSNHATLLDIDRGVPEVWGSTYDIRDLLNATIQMRDGKPLTEMNLPLKEKLKIKGLLDKIKGTDIARTHGASPKIQLAA